MPTDWETLKAGLPVGKSDEDKKKRAELWKQFNVTKSKSLALFELDAGIQKVFECEELFQAKPAVRKAHALAREVNPGGDPEKLEFVEFRMLLVYLKGLMDVHQIFTALDKSRDKVLSLDELKDAGPKLAEVGVEVKDPEELWKELKGTNDVVDFDEFSHWAVRQGLAGQELLEVAQGEDAAAKPASEAANAKVSDWEKLKNLPVGQSAEDKNKRKELWEEMNVTRTKHLALFELEAGVQKVLECEDLFKAKAAIRKAHAMAREVNPKGDPEKLEWAEFRLLLVYLRGFYEIHEAFTWLDTSKDRVLSRAELEAAGPKLASLGVNVKDPGALWTTLKGKNEVVDFTEFSDWAVRQGLGGQDLMEKVDAADQAQASKVLGHLSKLSKAGDGYCDVKGMVSLLLFLDKSWTETELMMLVEKSGCAKDGKMVIVDFVNFLWKK